MMGLTMLMLSWPSVVQGGQTFPTASEQKNNRPQRLPSFFTPDLQPPPRPPYFDDHERVDLQQRAKVQEEKRLQRRRKPQYSKKRPRNVVGVHGR